MFHAKATQGGFEGGFIFLFLSQNHTCTYKMHKYYNESTKIRTMHEIGTMLQHPLKAIIEIVFDSLSVFMCIDHECILKFEKHEVS